MKRFTVAVVAISGCILGPACQAIVGIEDRVEAPSTTEDAGTRDQATPTIDDASSDADPCAGNPTCVEPDAGPPLGCPTGCQAPVPAGWKGPSAVYDDVESTKPTSCPSSYAQRDFDSLFQGASGAPATCDCGTPSITNRKCTSTVVTYSDGACTTGENAIGKVAGCFVTASDVGIRYKVTAGSFSAGTCGYPNAKTTTPPPTYTKVNAVCTQPTSDVCPMKAECVVAPVPEQPYGHLCIYKDGNSACPNKDYGNKRFVAHKKITDSRACSACAGTASAGSCGTTWGNRASEGLCTSLPAPTDKTVDTCYVYNGSGTVVDTGAMQPSAGSCTTAGGAPTGTVSVAAADAVTFCCNF